MLLHQPKPYTQPVDDDEDDYVEEEVISLKPIGPGMQELEVDGTGTLRSPTPSFPVQGRRATQIFIHVDETEANNSCPSN